MGSDDRVLLLVPITLRGARAFVDKHHRHHRAPPGGLFAVGLAQQERVVGVAIVGRPVARLLQDGWTCEVTRVCVIENHPNANSMLYGACWRATKAIGWQRLITYTLEREPGTSLKAAGWKCLGQAGGGSWNRKSRPRVDTHPIEQKTLWEAA